MNTHYVRFGRRHRIPSTVEILDELRSGYIPGYARKSWAQFGFSPREPDTETAEDSSQRQSHDKETSL